MNRTMIERTGMSTNEDQTRSVLRRRSLIAGVGVLAAGMLAAKSAETVRASDGALQMGADNTPTAQTHLSASLDAQNPLLHLSADGAGNGLESYTGGTGVAVLGYAVLNDGVKGTTNTADGTHAGVHGTAAPGGNGVIGECDLNVNSYGVYGISDIGIAVRGQSTASGTGVHGTSYSSNGVLGQSTSGIGVYGKTATGLYGVVGSSGTSQGSAGLLGIATGPNAVGFGTVTTGGATFAGYFNGTTVVNGAFAVTGSKSAAVKDAAGDYRLMYSVESPEAWFEDFGTGTLANGKAEIKIDPPFAHHIRTDQYHVFITEHDQHNALHVTGRMAQGFTVQADDATLKAKGKSAASVAGTFSWRVVAKRADIKGERLAKFTMPPPLVAPEAPTLPGKKR